MPTFIALEPANHCMLHCPECPVGMRGAAGGQRQIMDPAIARRAIDEASPWAHTVIFHFQGEPLLNPHLAEIISYAHEHHMYTMLSTNAQTLSEEWAMRLTAAGLDRIIVSIDGLSQQSYERYRVGGRLDNALAAIRYLSQQPGHPEIVLQCLYLRSNEQDWAALKMQYKALGADRLEMKTAQFYDYENGNDEMPRDSRYSRYILGENGKYRLTKKPHNRCYRLWSGCVVTTSGTVLPCCFDKDHSFPLGNIMTQGLQEIVHSASAVRFRDRVLSARRDVSICGNCSE